MSFLGQWLGLVPYHQALDLQLNAWKEARRSNQAVILGLEHPAVVTLGIRAESEIELKVTPEELLSEGVDLVKIDRGGHATLHSPGQLVIYPVVPLRNSGLSVREYVDKLTVATSEFLKSLGVPAFQKGMEPGLYTEQGKIAFFGIRVRHGITQHGLSINVRNDLALFQKIRSCGLSQETFSCLQDYGCCSSLDTLFAGWLTHFKQVLNVS